MDNAWRTKVLEPIREGDRVLDLGCGTGDLCLALSKRFRDKGAVVGLDFSAHMLDVARRRHERLGRPAGSRFQLIRMSAEDLPLPQEPFDYVVSAFVLRNLYSNIDRILTGVYASLCDSGQIRFIDFIDPPNRLIAWLWRAYMNAVAGLYGHLLFGRKFPQGYMTASARRFPKPDEFVERLRRAGFARIIVRRFLFGVIVLYTASKSSGES